MVMVIYTITFLILLTDLALLQIAVWKNLLVKIDCYILKNYDFICFFFLRVGVDFLAKQWE